MGGGSCSLSCLCYYSAPRYGAKRSPLVLFAPPVSPLHLTRTRHLSQGESRCLSLILSEFTYPSLGGVRWPYESSGIIFHFSRAEAGPQGKKGGKRWSIAANSWGQQLGICPRRSASEPLSCSLSLSLSGMHISGMCPVGRGPCCLSVWCPIRQTGVEEGGKADLPPWSPDALPAVPTSSATPTGGRAAAGPVNDRAGL
jgi:hypothetical protein